MSPIAGSVEELLALAIRHLNAGQHSRARLLCEQAVATHPPHPAIEQLLAHISLAHDDAAAGLAHATASLALRPEHAPTLIVAAGAARALGALGQAADHCAHALRLQPERADLWFQLSLLRHDLHDLQGAAQALRELLRLEPQRAEAEVNLGIVLQEDGQLDAAMRAYGRAYRLREDTFGRIAHALATPNVGRVWLDLDALGASLRSAPA